MDKLDMKTENITQGNIEKIRQLFPNAVTEAKKNGKTELAIDFDMLKQELSESLIDEGKERYQMTWPGKRQAVVLANTSTTDTLRPCKEESVDFDNTQNLYIEGDNLNVLKLLRETYLGKIKMIYIDPPYNTGNDSFVYNDCYSMDEEEFLKAGGYYDENGNRVIDVKENKESNGRFHTDWLNMLYPRLRLARDLLTDDGVIFISIDDNEQANLKKICDEIFGENSFIGIFKWNRVAKAPSLSNSIRTKYEYIFAYCKNKLPPLYGKESYNKQGPLWHLPNKRAELVFPAQSIRISQTFSKGYYGGTYQVELLDNMVCKNGYNECSVRILACSAWGQSKINEYVNSGKTFEIKKSPLTMYTDLSSEGNYIAPSDLISVEECGVKRNTDADEDMKKMGIPFDYSKPVSLPQYLIKIATTKDKNSIILDFFSGSRKRKFIMVQLPEKCDEKSEAYKAGYKNICEIGKERIRRAGRKILELSLESLEKEGVIEKYAGKLSEIRSLEEVYGVGGTSLPADKTTAEGRDVCVGRPNAAGSGFDSVEYSGRTSSGNTGIYPIFESGKGLTGRTGNTIITMRSLEVLNGLGYRVCIERIRGNQQNDILPDCISKLQTLNSKLSIDIGFRVLKLDSSNMQDVYYNPAAVSQTLLDSTIDNIKPDRTPLDLLFQVMLELGVPLSAKIEENSVNGKTYYAVNGNDIIACFDDDIDEEVITAIAKQQPLYAVFKDQSFASDSVAINNEQLFKTYSPATNIKVV